MVTVSIQCHSSESLPDGDRALKHVGALAGPAVPKNSMPFDFGAKSLWHLEIENDIALDTKGIVFFLFFCFL